MIELVVVVTIVSVLSVGTLLAVGGGGRLMPGARAGDLQRQADSLAQALDRGRDTALFRRQPTGLQPLSAGWELVGYDMTAEVWGRVRPAEEAAGVLDWTVAGRAYRAPVARPDTPPPIRIMADGRVTPFSLRLRAAGQSLTCRADGASPLRCGAP